MVGMWVWVCHQHLVVLGHFRVSTCPFNQATGLRSHKVCLAGLTGHMGEPDLKIKANGGN